jgi:branched-chain amino acid transport system permease protein
VNVIFHLLIMSGIYIILALSLNLILGYAGLFSVGHGAFYGIGAYAGAILVTRFSFPFWGELLAAACIAGFFGFVIGFPTLRLRGDYLALATFGFAVIIYSTFVNWDDLTRGPLGIRGIPKVQFLSIQFNSLWSYTLLVGFFVLLTLFSLRRITHSAFGRVLEAIREDDWAAMAIGKNIAKFKVLAFVIGAFFAGIAGVLYAHYVTFIDPSSFALQESFLVFSMVIFGGMGSIGGSVAGAAILVILPEALRFLGLPSDIAANLRQLIYGALIVFIINWRPEGLFGKSKDIKVAEPSSLEPKVNAQ